MFCIIMKTSILKRWETMNHLEWYMKNEKRKEIARDKNEIGLINRQLQQALMKLGSVIDKEKYQDETMEINRHLVQSSIWELNYRNNYESERVALLQGLFISYILNKEGLEKDQAGLQHDVDRYLRQLGNVDWSLYIEYGRKKGEQFI